MGFEVRPSGMKRDEMGCHTLTAEGLFPAVFPPIRHSQMANRRGNGSGEWKAKPGSASNRFQEAYFTSEDGEDRRPWLCNRGFNESLGQWVSFCLRCKVQFNTNKKTIDSHGSSNGHRDKLKARAEQQAGQARMAAQLQEGNERRKRRIEEISVSPELMVLLMGRPILDLNGMPEFLNFTPFTTLESL